MREIRLANSDRVALVDDEDYDFVMTRSWYVFKQKGIPKYAAASRKIPRTRRNQVVLMHRFILDIMSSSAKVDHINHDGFDNRRSNLRVCTLSQNQYNKRGSVHSSLYKGVTFDKSRGAYRARILIDGRELHLGRFKSEKDAALAYDRAAQTHHGEFACINF